METTIDAAIPTFVGKGAGKSFESVCLEVSRIVEANGQATFGRYGVQASMIDGQWSPVASLPDCEGITAIDARQFVFDAKVCSAASFPLAKYTERRSNQKRQLDHMLKRADFGATCFFLIHFNARHLKTKSEPTETFAFPVYLEHHLWQSFERREIMSISRSDCADYGVRVDWICHSDRGTKLRPDIIGAVRELRNADRNL